jgi:hypothetical protein
MAYRKAALMVAMSALRSVLTKAETMVERWD